MMYQVAYPPQYNDVRKAFNKGKRVAKINSILSKIYRGYSLLPFDLEQATEWYGLVGNNYIGQYQVKLSAITGTASTCHEYDRSFRPLVSGHLKAEWESFAASVRCGCSIPTLHLCKFGDIYFILRREEWVYVSVLRAFNYWGINAHIYEPTDSKVHPPTIELLSYWESATRRSR